MGKGLYQHVRATWNRPKDTQTHMQRQNRMVEWRREPVNCRIERPTRLDAARRLGYKASKELSLSVLVSAVVVFVRVKSISVSYTHLTLPTKRIV